MKSFTKYFSENLYAPYTSDLCINCKDLKPISDFAYLQYQDGKIEAGPICKDCYQVNKTFRNDR